MLPVQGYTLTLKVTPEVRKTQAKTADGEWLHGTSYASTITGPIPQTENVTKWTVDDLVNAHKPSPFVNLAALRPSIQKTTFRFTTCLLDYVVPLFLTLPDGWNWHPAEAHPPVQVVADPTPEMLAAIPLLMAVRGEIQAREKVSGTLNLNNVTVVPTKAAKAPQQVLKLNWPQALKAGRAKIDYMLSHADESEYAVGVPESLNRHLLVTMCQGDPTGLGRLLELGLIDPSGKQGNSFQAMAAGNALQPDNSGDLNAAYNHLRFVLYLEFRVLRQMLYGR